ncbi:MULTISPECIES: peptide ABC transporter substrate-binding protein [Bacillales]|jgi:dipeptide transport system substrate-binding protein|uniref:Peptide ABC transporter substrate-binding protein n=1 Tax=Brevibacillus aydinogluensis TaxID=927786 RepID=A0AA48MC18_9BACL|nr:MULTISPECIES: peptide ABC transporter substrate-binding protein [Bacillales]REK63285.1 MAG: oligopeptide ABC transporter substrate-binding protein [Brevibacillus sp.]MBR8660830.1 peptide ABC transporter substrate-binding protein [Brevibacillus sp. NL20B1]MDT3414307.1 dipeptide transport system substrate-binding protein [Brevibacillus aydinogluensis]NNV03430.1 peptide ABC transporter substrate-binding protein [Brevibacillus sp. MCWH]UFJ59903.1 peptide ABC transporter substrate-binding protei
MKLRKGWKVLSTSALLLALMVTGCNQSAAPNQPGKGQTAEAGGEADTTAKLRLNLRTEPPSLDPPKGFDSVSNEVLNAIMEGLVRLDKDHKPQPAMAEQWTISDDGKTYTFTLRDSKWSNGDPVTAHDFEYAWKRIVDPQNAFPSAFLAYFIEGAEKFNKGEGSADDVKVKALDDRTLEVKLTAPTGFFLNIITQPTFFPVHKKSVESNPNFAAEASTLITNGPFKLTEWVHDQTVKVEKNEGYWDKDSVKIAGIDWVMVNDENTQYQMYKTGQLDMVQSVPNDLKKRLIDSGEAKVMSEASVYYYRMNTSMPPFTNKNIRKAFALAIDRKALIENVTQGNELPALAHVPTGLLEPDGRDFREVGGDYFKDNDVEQAKALLKKGMEEEGWTTLPPVTMTYNTSDAHKAIAQVLQEMYKKNLGVDVKLENKEWNVFLAEQRARKLQFSRSTIPADYADPYNFLELYTTDHPGNRINYSNKEYDALVQKIRSTADETERFKLMHEAEKIFMEDMPIVPIYFRTVAYMEQPNVNGIVRHAVGTIDYKWAVILKK